MEGGLIVRMAETDPPPVEAVMVAVVVTLTGVVLIEKPPLERNVKFPTTAEELLEVRTTNTPDAGVRPSRVRMPCTSVPPATTDWFRLRATGRGGLTTKVVALLIVLYEFFAVRVIDVCTDTGLVLMVAVFEEFD